MNYAVDYAEVGPTRVVSWVGPGQMSEPMILKTDKEKLEFVLKTTHPNDVIWTELGGAVDVFCLVASRHGAVVYRLPPYRFKDLRTLRGTDKTQDVLLLAD